MNPTGAALTVEQAVVLDPRTQDGDTEVVELHQLFDCEDCGCRFKTVPWFCDHCNDGPLCDECWASLHKHKF